MPEETGIKWEWRQIGNGVPQIVLQWKQNKSSGVWAAFQQRWVEAVLGFSDAVEKVEAVNEPIKDRLWQSPTLSHQTEPNQKGFPRRQTSKFVKGKSSPVIHLPNR